MKKNKLNLKNSIVLLFLLFLSFASVQAQVAVTVTGATNTTPNLAASYTSFANFTTALNAVTAMSGPVSVVLGAGTEIAPPKGFTIGSPTLNAATSNFNFVYIQGTYASATNQALNTTLVGGVGTGTAASAQPDGILKLVGADYIYLELISFRDPTTNASPTTAMEFGLALFKASATDGCQGNYFNTNFFYMQSLNTTAGSGPMINGAAAIMIINALPTAATTVVTVTANSGASTDNSIFNNTIIGGASGISLYGFAPTSTPYNFVDTRNAINGNAIYNFGGGIPQAIANGIITRAQWETDIQNNIVDNNDGNGVNNTSHLYGISVFNASITNSIVSNNLIKLQSGATAGFQVYGINNSINSGGNVPGYSVAINNNNISMAQPLTTSVGNIRGINCTSSSENLSISGNTISGLSPFGVQGSIYGIATSGTATTTTINNNSIKNFNRTAATGNTFGIYALGTAATTTATTGPTNVIANGNTIDNLTFTAADNAGVIYGINPSTNTITNTINNNIVKNLATGTSGAIYGIYDNGIAGTKVCQNNQIFNFSTPAGVGTGSNNPYFGIFFTNNAIAAFNVDISSNSIYSLNNSSTGTNGEIYAIYCTALQPSFIYKNKIYDLSYAGTNTSTNGWVSGIFALNNVSTIYNNTIADLRMPNYAQPAQKLFGIRVGNANLYYNTVFLNGTNASSAAVFSFTAGSLKLNNNIFINKVTPNTGGIASAYSRGDTTISTYDASSNNNLFAGTNIFYDGVNTDATLAAYKTRMAFRDQASVTEVTTPFTSTVGSNANFLQLATNAVSVANNAALPITSPAITTDYFGVTRSTTTPDIGASEFNGLVCTLPVAYAITGGGAYCAGGTGVPVGVANSEIGMTYQLKIGGTNTGTTIAGTGAAFSFPNQTVAGTYTVEANNSNSGCPQTVTTMTGSAIITIDPVSVGGSIAGTTTKCSTTNSGTLTLSGTTGAVLRWESAVSPFTVWTPIANTSLTYNYTNLAATTQFRAVVQSGSCASATSSIATITVTTIVAATAQTNIACNGSSTGALSISPAGGTLPYTYLWSNGATTQSITGLSAGAYSVTVTDASSCSLTRNFTLTQPAAAVSGTTVVTNVACFGGSNGAINLTPSGGTAPYTFNWGGGVTTEDRTGLAVGSYSVTITDTNGCTGTISATVTQPPALVVTANSQTNISCFGGSNGAASISTPTGGTAPYSYNWTPGNPTGDGTTSVTGLTAGTWTCTVTDANSCTASRNFTVTQPASAVSGTAVITNIACNGGATGSINLTPSGGTPGYTFNWVGGITTEDRTGLVAGTYSVTITDTSGCTAIRSFTITQPTAISGTTVITNVSCNGGSNGAINLTPSGGTSPYTYNWGGGITTEDRTGLSAGTYAVTITDANGCTGSVSVTVTQPSAPVSGTTVITNVSCNGGSNGAINLTPSGGTAPYTFNWGGGITTEDRTGLSAGTYSVTITDTNGCTGIVSGISVTQPATIIPTFTQVAPICSGATLAALPTTSTNSIVGTWSPALDNANTTTYTFTPSTGQCGTTATMTITVNPPAPNISYTGVASTYPTGTAISALNPSNTGGTPTSNTSGTPIITTIGSGFSNPGGVAVDASGTVYVADSYNNAIKKIVGSTVTTLGSGFSLPYSVAVDASGTVYVADSYNSAIKKIVGSTVTTLGSGFNIPFGVAVDASGKVYVGDTYNNAVKEINGTIVSTLGSGFSSPFGVAVDAAGAVYVADTNNSAIKKIVGTTVTTIGSGFSYPKGVVVDGAGAIYVADTFNNAIKKIVGSTITTLGSGFSSPNAVAIDATGAIYIADTNNNAIKKMVFPPYSISPALPTGLSIDANTGVISGTPTVGSPTTTYTISTSNSCGANTATVTFATCEPFTASIAVAETSGTTNNDGVICSGDSVTLTASGGASYVWSNGATTASITVNLTATTTYGVTATNASGCTGTAITATVTVNPSVTPTFTQVAPICSGSTLAALPTTSNNSITGTWSPALDNTVSTTYTFTPSSGQCGSTASMTITVNTTAQPTRDNTISGTLCNNATIGTLLSKFNNSANVSCYAAATGGSPLSASQVIAPVNTNITFYLTQTVSGCESTRVAYSAFVNYVNPPTAAATQSFCTGATVSNLVATPANGASISGWFAASAGGTAIQNTTALTTGTYYVGQSHISSCASQRTLVNVTVSTVDTTITESSGVLTATQNGATYQWIQCPSTLISGETNQSFTPTVAGDYKVDITLNGCTVTSNCLTVTTLGTTDFDSTSFNYYPNPTNGILNVNYASEISKIEVSNILGQEVMVKNINAKEGQIDMQFLPSGTYLVKVSSDDKVKTIKIVKQ